jgi:hypothetical protein
MPSRPAHPHRAAVEFHDANCALSDAFHRVGTATETIEQVLDSRAQVRAFGAPGEAGNAAAIRHLAHRILSVYEELLDAATQIRSIDPPDLLRRMFEIASRYMEGPIAQFRRFIDTAVQEMEQLPDRASDLDEPRAITLDLVLRIDDDRTGMRETHELAPAYTSGVRG